MKCGECGGEFRDVRGDLRWKDRYAGTLVVPDIAYRQCDGCAEVLLPPRAADAIEAARRKKLEEWLENRPLKDFWDSQQVTRFLGISRQALSKGVQLNNLVYKIRRNGKYFYLADSVREYKRTGDGRTRLEFAAETVVPRLPDRVMGDSDAGFRVVLDLGSGREHRKPGLEVFPLYVVPTQEEVTHVWES